MTTDNGERCDRHVGEVFPPRCNDCEALNAGATRYRGPGLGGNPRGSAFGPGAVPSGLSRELIVTRGGQRLAAELLLVERAERPRVTQEVLAGLTVYQAGEVGGVAIDLLCSLLDGIAKTSPAAGEHFRHIARGWLLELDTFPDAVVGMNG